MRYVKILIGLIFLFILYYAITYLSDNWRPLNDGRLSYSKNISESKKRNVFIQEYNFHFNADSSYGFVYPDIEEVWIEKIWKNGMFKWDTNILENRTNNNRICIRINNPNLKRYSVFPSAKNFPRWVIDRVNNANSGFTNWDSLMVNKIFGYSNIDTLIYPINLILNSSWDEEQIGELKLIKK